MNKIKMNKYDIDMLNPDYNKKKFVLSLADRALICQDCEFYLKMGTMKLMRMANAIESIEYCTNENCPFVDWETKIGIANGLHFRKLKKVKEVKNDSKKTDDNNLGRN